MMKDPSLNYKIMSISVSVVSYLNSIPFQYGLEHSGYTGQFKISTDIPSVCADKLIQGKADIGLIPSAEMLKIDPHYLVSDLCIGARGIVDSVILASSVPIHEIHTIYLDYHSRTSVLLARILAAAFWNIQPRFVSVTEDLPSELLSEGTAMVAIGDKTFQMKALYSYDLSEQWMQWTGLPFVFACWVSRIKLTEHDHGCFNKALHWGVEHLKEAIAARPALPCDPETAYAYLTERIDYPLTKDKLEALHLFHRLIRKIA